VRPGHWSNNTYSHTPVLTLTFNVVNASVFNANPNT
jgi:hypothetical protein